MEWTAGVSTPVRHRPPTGRRVGRDTPTRPRPATARSQASEVEPGHLALAARIEEILGDTVDPRIVRAVAQLTGGDRAAVTEVILDAKETGCLVRGAEAWELCAPLPTRRLVALASGRLAGLPATVREDAKLLALGSPLPLRIARRILDPARVRELERRGLAHLRRTRDRHEVVIGDAIQREGLLGELDLEQRTRLLRRLADAFEETGGAGRDDLLRVARWRLQVGGWSAERFAEAAARAYVANDPTLAERLASRAVEQGDRAHGLILRAVTLAAHGAMEEAAAAEELARQHADDVRARVRVALASAHRRGIGEGRWRAAAGALEVELERLPSGEMADEVRSYAALVHAFDTDPRRVDALLSPRPAEGMSDPTARAVGAVASAFAAEAQLDRPRLKQALAAVTELDARQTGVPLAVDLARGLHLLAADPRAPQDRVRDATRDLDHALGGADASIAWWATVAGRLHLAGGDLESARRRFMQSLSMTTTCDPVRLRPRVVADLALVAALGGVPAEAERGLRQLVDDRRISRVIATRCELVEVVVAAQYEGPRAATTLALDCGDRAATDGRWSDAVLAWHLTARLGDARPAAQRLAQPGRLPDHPTVVLARRHATALAAGDGRALTEAAMDLAGEGRYLVAAEAAAQAARLIGSEQAHALAAGLASACTEVRSPTLDGIGRLTLSPRRREVARAAAVGTPGPVIAEQLGLSLRTVNNHLAKVYRQLGVGGRRELRRAYRADRAPLAEPR